MNLELDHFFILVEPGAKVADSLLDLGFEEGSGNTHPGQGTSNRRFYFSNGMLEFLWVHDADEANQGPGSRLGFPQRASNPSASPFGLILHRTDNSDSGMPFDGWEYQPDYFNPPWAFHVGANSDNLLEPLCIYVPFIEPGASRAKTDMDSAKTITQVSIYTPAEPVSDVLKCANKAQRLMIGHNDQHLMMITLDDQVMGMDKDFRPKIPLIIRW